MVEKTNKWNTGRCGVSKEFDEIQQGRFPTEQRKTEMPKNKTKGINNEINCEGIKKMADRY